MRRLGVPLSVLLALLILAPAASAEWFADAYIGAAVTSASTLSFTVFEREQEQDLKGRSSPVFGLRGGRWFDGQDLPWLGVALDLSYFRPAPDVQTIPLTLLIMARYGLLKDQEFPHGRLQPYVGVGGGVFVSNLSGSVGFQEGDDTSTDMGLDTRAGVSYLIDSNWALFTEYRFTHVNPSWKVKVFGGETSADTTFNTHHVILGVSYRF
jgi:hypothetical protein